MNAREQFKAPAANTSNMAAVFPKFCGSVLLKVDMQICVLPKTLGVMDYNGAMTESFVSGRNTLYLTMV